MKIKVGDITKIKTGKLDANASSVDGKYPFFTCSKEPLRINTYSYDCECVLVAGNGDLNVKYYNGKFDAYQRTYIIENDSDGLLYMPYLYYFLEGYIEELRKQSIGGVIKYIKLGNLTDAMIELPTIEKQKYIVNLLRISSELINLRKKTINKLDKLIKARFVEMFGDPLLNDRGWPCKRIGDLFEVISRGKQPTYVEHSTVRVINQACVYWDRINMDNAKYHDEQSAKKMLPISEYSILINSTGTGTLGRCNVFPELRDDYVYVVDSHVTTLQESSEINAWFFKWFFQHNGIQAKIYSECVNGSTNQIELSREKLSNAMMIVPPIELQNQFAEFVIETNKLKSAIQAALDKTQLLFDSLMQEYFG